MFFVYLPFCLSIYFVYLSVSVCVCLFRYIPVSSKQWINALGVVFPVNSHSTRLAQTPATMNTGRLTSSLFLEYGTSMNCPLKIMHERLEVYSRRRSEQCEAVCEHLSVFVVLHGRLLAPWGWNINGPTWLLDQTNIRLLQVMYTWSICTIINQLSWGIDTSTAPGTEMDWKLKININNYYYFSGNIQNTGL